LRSPSNGRKLELRAAAPTFPKARYLIGRREYDVWSAHDDEEQQTVLSDSVKPIFDECTVLS
jgi:hypothetical protein